jgi:hypothetical protein
MTTKAPSDESAMTADEILLGGAPAPKGVVLGSVMMPGWTPRAKRATDSAADEPAAPEPTANGIHHAPSPPPSEPRSS